MYRALTYVVEVLWDQVYYTDPAYNYFWEPAGDSTHLVHCKGRPRGVRLGLGPGGLTKRAQRAIDLCRFADIRTDQHERPRLQTSLALNLALVDGCLVSPIP